MLILYSKCLSKEKCTSAAPAEHTLVITSPIPDSSPINEADITYSEEDLESPDMPMKSGVIRLLKKEIVECLDERFPELAEHLDVKVEIVEILFWRDVRL